MKNTNYITVLGWMINQLKLKGNELLLFAIIYGFSQDGKSGFTGSLSYICEALNVSRNTAIKTAKSLVEKGFIMKQGIINNGISFNKYLTVDDIENIGSAENALVQELTTTSAETLQGVVQKMTAASAEIAPNITINSSLDNTSIDIPPTTPKKSKDFSSEVIQCYKSVLDFFPEKFRPDNKSKQDNWLDCVDKLNRLDGYSFEKIKEITLFARNDNLWSPHFLSLLKLRTKDGNKVPYVNIFDYKLGHGTIKKVNDGGIQSNSIIEDNR